VALASEFLPCPDLLLNLQAVSGGLSVAQAVLSAALPISLALSWAGQAVLPDCPATLSICRDARTAAMSACQAVSSAWRVGPLYCPGKLPVCPALRSAELWSCQAVSSA